MYPYCDVEGAISGEPETCISVACEPGSIAACVEDAALTCNANGDGYDRVPCELGCKSSPSPHCGFIEPRYVPDVCASPATSDALVVSGSVSLDPNLDITCTGGLIPQANSPDICVVHFKTISVQPQSALAITGTRDATGRPIALVADMDLTIEGTLDVGAKGVENGPGGGITFSGGAPNYSTKVGGGGAGGQTAGGSGGSASLDGGAFNAGGALADPALLGDFMGGAASYRETNGDSAGGGGVVTLVSCRGQLAVSGRIMAGGGGGRGGVFVELVPGSGSGFAVPGEGGGAGGYVVLQGAHISVSGSMFANGSGGGAGMQSNNAAGAAGANGTDGPPLGGFEANGGGRGGTGGFASTAPGVGGKPTSSLATAGGGGGSVGFFQAYSPEGFEPSIVPVELSPPMFQPKRTLVVR